jgi:putative oxidoreductase
MAQFVFTEEHSAGLVARITLAVVLLPHGLQKGLGMFGGKGLIPSLDDFVLQGIPYYLGIAVIAGETLGAVLLLIGLAGRFMAAWVAVIMLGTIIKVHYAYGFFMNWNGLKQGEGFEYHILVLGLAMIIMIAGSGTASVDRALTRRYWG